MTDELDDHASAHCSHLSPSVADWRRKMVNALTAYSVPLSLTDRYSIYESSRIPQSVYKELDLSALHTALSERHARITKSTV
jgi:hypothetical protein